MRRCLASATSNHNDAPHSPQSGRRYQSLLFVFCIACVLTYVCVWLFLFVCMFVCRCSIRCNGQRSRVCCTAVQPTAASTCGPSKRYGLTTSPLPHYIHRNLTTCPSLHSISLATARNLTPCYLAPVARMHQVTAGPRAQACLTAAHTG